MVSLRKIEQGLRKGDRTSVLQRAQRIQELMNLLSLEQIWDIYPDLYVDEDEHNDTANKVYDALNELTQDFWNQAKNCYVDSMFIASVLLSAASLETALKYKLVVSGINNPYYGLGTCISKCVEGNILPPRDSAITLAAATVNNIRNDIIHSNIARHSPETIIYFDGPEHTKSDLIFGIQEVGFFKNSAIASLKSAKLILDHLLNPDL